jgi:hypothetical protein
MLKTLILIIFLFSGMALADIVTVCMDGSCNEKTIQDAIDKCGEGDRIEVYG